MAMTRSNIGPGRLEAFSDGVIAIIVTIMVLELRFPEHVTDKGLLNGLLVPMSPKLASHALSILVVGDLVGEPSRTDGDRAPRCARDPLA